MAWTQLRVRTAHAAFAEEILLDHGAQSVTVTDAADAPILEPRPGETPVWADAVVTGLFAQPADTDAVSVALADLLPDGASAAISHDALDDTDWVRECLKDARPMCFGRRLWVCPSNHRVDAPDAVVVDLDPGLAFGTGTHPTTAMCLRWLDGQELTGKRVLDFGCGSGILAVAALKLGAVQVTAVDIDPQAVQATRANATLNGVGDRLQTMLPDAYRVAEHDLVLANILANPLIELAPTITASVRPGGQLALAGLLVTQAAAVTAAYADQVPLMAVERDADWVCLAGQRAAAG